MAEFLTTIETSKCIEKILTEAKESIYLVTPLLKLSETLHAYLSECSKKGVKIIILYGKEELSNNEHFQLSEIKNLHLYFYHKLNAKCYYNENKMLFTSMNLHEFSEKNHHEMGIFLNLESDPAIYNKALNDTISIIQKCEKR